MFAVIFMDMVQTWFLYVWNGVYGHGLLFITQNEYRLE